MSTVGGKGIQLSFLLANALTLSRWQFATTTLYHFTFVPLTLGLAPLLAIMQTLYYRTHDEKWNRLVRFFAVLFLINFAIGAATGLVQEFEFGMNWSAFSKYVGDVFGAPLAIEGLGAFMLESTFIGLWVFGREHLSPRVHLATIYLVWLGTWLSAYFIIVANSWMQHPVGYQINKSTGTAQATDIATIMFQKFAIFAYVHVILAGCLTGGFVVLGVSAWHLRRGRNVEVFRAAAKLTILLLIPLAAVQLWWGNAFGIQTTNAQPMKIAATEALWNTQQPATVLDLPDRRLHEERPDAVVLDRDPGAALLPRDRLVPRQGRRSEPEPGAAGGPARAGELPAAGRARVLVHARDGLSRRSDAADRALGRLAFVAQEARAGEVVPADCDGRDRRPVSRVFRRLDPDRDRPPALDRLRPAEDRRRGLAELDDDEGRVQPRGVPGALHRARDRRLLSDAPLRTARSTRDRRRRGRSGAGPGAQLLMQTAWFWILFVLWSLYFVTEGFDFGVGMLLPILGRSEHDRRTMIQSIGPVWDGNEVWLIIAGAATFAAFPAWYATMFSGFYVALLLLLVFLITRIVSFEWRGKAESAAWRSFWTWVNAIASLAIPLIWGIALVEPPARRPGLVGAGVHRQLLGSLHAVHGCRGPGVRAALRAPRRRLPRDCARTATCGPRRTVGGADSLFRRRSAAPRSSSGR